MLDVTIFGGEAEAGEDLVIQRRLSKYFIKNKTKKGALQTVM